MCGWLTPNSRIERAGQVTVNGPGATIDECARIIGTMCLATGRYSCSRERCAHAETNDDVADLAVSSTFPRIGT
jgi:hypothetical protein